MTADDDLNEKINELQLQLYIAMAVGFLAIIILLILEIILYGIVERLKRHMKNIEKEKQNKRQNGGSTFSESIPRAEIHPGEDLAQRGYRKYPNYSSGLVARVESRQEPSYSRQHSVPSRQQSTS